MGASIAIVIPFEKKSISVLILNKEFSLSTAKWKTIKAAKTVSLTKKSADGATIYVRYKGTLETVKKGIEFRLPSAYSSFTVNGFQ